MQHLSASRLALYSDCSLKYKFRYIDKISKPAISVHLAYGTAIHKAVEMLNLSLAKTKIDLEDMMQYFHDEYEKEVKAMRLENDFFRWKLYEMGVNAIEKYYNEFVDYEVLGSEFKFDVPIIYPDGTKCETHSLYGFVDSIIKRKSDIMIVDYKTAKEQFPKFKIDTSIQLAVYSYAFRWLLQEKKLIKNFPNIKKDKEDFISYYLFLKDYDTLNGKIKIQRKKITDKEINKMLYICKKTLEAEKAEIFIPNYDSMCKYCEYKKNCIEF